MSLREVFDAGLLDYMLTGEGANIIGRVGDIGQPASPECLIHTIDLHYGPGDLPHGLAGGFSIVAECVMDRAGFRELVPRAGFRATHDFLQALDGYARG
ncbi:MAG TPA: hypothetical protein VKI43_00830 [Vicinamibacterales bacterium]|nr:hypothetical protein [Vicinamibacterales bacterium]